MSTISDLSFNILDFGKNVAPIKARRNGFVECRIESYCKANVKLVISQICIVT
jgi:hypothetical protein